MQREWLSVLSRALDLGASRVISALTTIFILGIASRGYSTIEYSKLREALLLFEIVAPILLFGLPQTLHFFIGKLHASWNLIRASLLLLFTLGTIYILITLATVLSETEAGNIIDRLHRYLVPIAVYGVLDASIQSLATFLISSKQTRILALASIISSLISVPTILYVVNLGLDPSVIIIIRASCALLNITIIAAALSKSAISTPEAKTSLGNTLRQVKELVAMGAPLVGAGIVGTLSQTLDRIIVSTYASAEEFAVYTNGAFEVPFIGIVVGSISTVLLAEMSTKVQRGQKQEAHELFSIAANKSALFIFPLAVILIVNAELLMAILFGSAYRQSADVFAIYCLLLPCRIVVYGAALVSIGKTRLILIRALGELALNCAISLVLYHVLGPIGVAIGSVIAIYAWSVALNLRSIASGFGVSFRTVLDFTTLSRIAIAVLGLSIIFPLTSTAAPADYQDHVRAGTSVLYLTVLYIIFLRSRWSVPL